MKHARQDYTNRIQDSAGLIPDDEPVFLLRGQDSIAAKVVRYWASEMTRLYGHSAAVDLALTHAEAMEAWPIKKQADTTTQQALGVDPAQIELQLEADEPDAPAARTQRKKN